LIKEAGHFYPAKQLRASHHITSLQNTTSYTEIMADLHKTPSEEGMYQFCSSFLLPRHPFLPTNTSPEIADTLGNLQLSATVPQKTASKPKSKPVADSWDLDSSGSDTETEDNTPTTKGAGSGSSPHNSLQPLSTVTSRDNPPHPPPPTPASPTQFEYPDNAPYNPFSGVLGSDNGGKGGRGAGGLDKRPEKTTAVAGRMIAAGLGVRAPKRTDEEKEFDRAMREKERKRRAEEKERERREADERERRKKAVWDD
jgi:hypothetical protein